MWTLAFPFRWIELSILELPGPYYNENISKVAFGLLCFPEEWNSAKLKPSYSTIRTVSSRFIPNMIQNNTKILDYDLTNKPEEIRK